MDINWIQAALGSLGVIATIGAAYAVLRAEGLRASVSIMRDTNADLREQITADREECDRKLAKETERRHQGEARWAEEAGNLRGQIETLQSEALKAFTVNLTESVETVLRAGLASVLESRPPDGQGTPSS